MLLEYVGRERANQCHVGKGPRAQLTIELEQARVRQIALAHQRTLDGWSAQPGIGLGQPVTIVPSANAERLAAGFTQAVEQHDERQRRALRHPARPKQQALLPKLSGFGQNELARTQRLRLTSARHGSEQRKCRAEPPAPREHGNANSGGAALGATSRASSP